MDEIIIPKIDQKDPPSGDKTFSNTQKGRSSIHVKKVTENVPTKRILNWTQNQSAFGAMNEILCIYRIKFDQGREIQTSGGLS